MRRFVGPFLLASLAICAVPAGAQSLAKTKLALHVVAANTASCAPIQAACADAGTSALTTSASPGVFDVYVLAVDVNPAAGLQAAAYSIEPGLNINPYSFTSCSATVGPRPVSGASALQSFDVIHSFDSCQQVIDPSDPEGEALVVLTYLQIEVLGDAYFSLSQRQDVPIPDAWVEDCSSVRTDLDVATELGAVGFNTAGFDPCTAEPVPTEEKTWGGIKRTFGD